MNALTLSQKRERLAHTMALRLGGTVCPLCSSPSTVAPTPPNTQADEEALLSAARDGNVSEVMRLLDKGVNKDYQNSVRYLRVLFFGGGMLIRRLKILKKKKNNKNNSHSSS